MRLLACLLLCGCTAMPGTRETVIYTGKDGAVINMPKVPTQVEERDGVITLK